MHGQDTLPRLFRHVVQRAAATVAMREKHLGIWRSITWREYGERARHVGPRAWWPWACGRATWCPVIADNCPEWLYADLGTMSVGGVTNGIYTTDSARQVEYIVNDSGTRFFFAENEEQLDKILEVRARCPQLVKIVVFDTEGLHGFRDDQVMPFEALPGAGRPLRARAPRRLRRDGGDRAAERPGHPRLHLRHHGAAQGRHAEPPQHHLPARLRRLHRRPARRATSSSPSCRCRHVAERTFTVFYPLRTGATVNFAESIDTVPENIREVAPAVFFAVPRIWEKFYSGVALRMREATPAGQARLPLGPRRRHADGRAAHRGPAAAAGAAPASTAWPDFLVLDNVKRSLGLHRTRGAATGAAPIAPELIKWYLALGIDMREVYGQTENCGLGHRHAGRPHQARHGGRARARTPRWRSRPPGEIFAEGAARLPRLLQEPEQARRRRWSTAGCAPGDVGAIDADGFVRITDRMKDIIITAGGKNITPVRASRTSSSSRPTSPTRW